VLNDDNRKVSVIIPVYNAEKYIGDALDSVVYQNYKDMEVIVVDDCSTDHSCEIIKKYMKKYPYIHYIRLDNNKGVAFARNVAINMASGRFIAFLDSDDIWEKCKLIKQVKLFDLHKGIPFTYTALSYIDENGVQIKGKRELKEQVSYSYLLRNTCVATSTVIVDRAVVPLVEMPDRKSAEDYSLWLSLLKTYGDAYGINEAFTRYRKTANSISANKVGEVKYFYKVQIEDIKIKRNEALFNTFCYIINAMKKHFL